jgi:hypothetical protein
VWCVSKFLRRKEWIMLVKKALLSALSLVMVASVLTQSATEASMIKVGDTIRFFDREGSTGGGEFGVARLPNQNTELFRTFCLERNEYIDFNQAGFRVDSITNFADAGGVGGGSPDYLDPRTAWLYYHFRMGSLTGYDYGAGRVTSANNLQNAIWRLEDEITGQAGNPFIIAANAASTEALAFAASRVRVMNISWATTRGGYVAGQRAQSMLTLIPEPGSMLVWAVLGLAGAGMTNRRRRS